jgi:spore coat protein CotF
MQTNPYGAHEVLELHEVMNTAIDSCHTLQLFVPYVRDPELRQILMTQLPFMQNEYNNLVHLVQGVGVGAAVPYRANVHMTTSMVPQPQNPAQSNGFHAQLDDRDVASAMVSTHKSGAKLKMSASLEAANPQIRNALLQGAINCANMAYEVWGYMQRKGFYPLASLQETAQAQLLRGYQPVAPEQQQADMYMQAAISPTDGGTGFTTAVEPASAILPETATDSTGQPPAAAPKSSVNASQIFSSPAYRQEHPAVADDQTEMVHDGASAQMVDPLAVLTNQTDARTARASRKKAVEPDNSIIG